MPASSATSTTRCGVSSRLTPSFSRTSEAPLRRGGGAVAVLDDLGAGARDHDRRHRGDVDGLGAVAAGADDVDRVGPGTSITLACSYIARTRPEISSTVSPLARSATANPAICASVASPRMMRSIAQAVSSALRSRPSSRRVQELGPGAGRRAVAACGGHNVHGPAPGCLACMGRGSPYPARRAAKSPVQCLDGALTVATMGSPAARTGVRAVSSGDQWWPWPLVISLYSSTVGLGIWLSSP